MSKRIITEKQIKADRAERRRNIQKFIIDHPEMIYQQIADRFGVSYSLVEKIGRKIKPVLQDWREL